MSKIVGYARTSTGHQDLGLDVQLKELKSQKANLIFSEQISGRRLKRKELQRALDSLEPGDTLLLYKLDRLGRNALQLIKIVTDLNQQGITIRTIVGGIDTSNAAGRLSLLMMAAVSQYESDVNSERVKDALKLTTKKSGRPRKITNEIKLKVCELYRNPALTVVTIAKMTGISPKSVTTIAHEAGLSREKR